MFAGLAEGLPPVECHCAKAESECCGDFHGDQGFSVIVQKLRQRRTGIAEDHRSQGEHRENKQYAGRYRQLKKYVGTFCHVKIPERNSRPFLEIAEGREPRA